MIAWFVCPYKRLPRNLPMRGCSMLDFSAQIRSDGGSWSETEVLGNVALVKVSASAATLTAIEGAAGFIRLPLTSLSDPLTLLNPGQRNQLRGRITALGYSTSEFDAAVPNLATATFGDVLNFAATRRLKPRYDSNTDTIVIDGPVQNCKPVSSVDSKVKE